MEEEATARPRATRAPAQLYVLPPLPAWRLRQATTVAGRVQAQAENLAAALAEGEQARARLRELFDVEALPPVRGGFCARGPRTPGPPPASDAAAWLSGTPVTRSCAQDLTASAGEALVLVLTSRRRRASTSSSRWRGRSCRPTATRAGPRRPISTSTLTSCATSGATRPATPRWTVGRCSWPFDSSSPRTWWHWTPTRPSACSCWATGRTPARGTRTS